jgi:urate oxidase
MNVDTQVGERGVNVIKITRGLDLHQLRDVTVDVAVETAGQASDGSDATAPSAGTLRQAVYSLAQDALLDDIELFGLVLSEHVVRTVPGVARVRINLVERLWSRLMREGKPHPHTFTRHLGERRIATVTRTRDGAEVEAGLTGLDLLKTTTLAEGAGRSAPADRPDEILAATVEARWRYTTPDAEFGLRWRGIKNVLVERFAEHAGRSLGELAHLLASAALDACDEIDAVEIGLAAARWPRPAVDGGRGLYEILTRGDDTGAHVKVIERRD